MGAREMKEKDMKKKDMNNENSMRKSALDGDPNRFIAKQRCSVEVEEEERGKKN